MISTYTPEMVYSVEGRINLVFLLQPAWLPPLPSVDVTDSHVTYLVTSFSIDMTMSLYLFLDMYLHSGEYHVGTVGIDIRNYIFAVLMR